MIPHKKLTYPSGFTVTHDVSQKCAEDCNRQEVTADWYLSIGVDNNMQLYAWTNDEDHIMGLDPWRMIDGPDDMPESRYFVQVSELIEIEYGVDYD